MADIIEDADVPGLNTEYPLGPDWDIATASQRLAAVNLTQGVWRSLDWTEDPFEDKPGRETLRNTLRPLLALHSRATLETGGTIKQLVPPEIMALLRQHLVRRKMSPLVAE